MGSITDHYSSTAPCPVSAHVTAYPNPEFELNLTMNLTITATLTLTLALTAFQLSAVPTPNHARVTLLYVTVAEFSALSQNSAISCQIE